MRFASLARFAKSHDSMEGAMIAFTGAAVVELAMLRLAVRVKRQEACEAT